MSNKFQKALQGLVPFVLLGFIIALLIGLIVVFSYLFVWALIIGSVLWLISLIKQYFFKPKKIVKNEGRIIEHDKKK
jgi:hypothetical protein